MKSIPVDALLRAQREDPVIGPILRAKAEITGRPTDEGNESAEGRVLLREWDRLERRADGLLFRGIQDANRGKTQQLVLPKRHREEALYRLHNNMGHMGVERTLMLARERFFWPFMARDIARYVTKQCSCIEDKAPT